MPDDPIVVEVEGLGLIEFPAGTSGAQMEAALRQATMQAKRGEPSLFDRAVSTAADVGIGALKGLGSTAMNVGELWSMVPVVGPALTEAGNTIGGMVGEAVYGRQAKPATAEKAYGSAREALAPTNTAQTVGKVGEQIAEVIVPGRAISSAAQTAATKAAPVLSRVVGRTAGNVAPRAAVEAAGGATLSAAQGGDPTVGGIVSGAVPVVGQAVRGAAPALKASAIKRVEQALGGRKERFKAMAERLAPEVLKRGLRGSRESLLAQAADAAEAAGERIDDAIQQFGGRTADTTPIIEALEQAKGAFQTTRSLPLMEAIRTGAANQRGARIVGNMVEVPIVFEPRSVQQLDKLQQTVAALGDDVRVDQLIAVRRAWDRVVDQAGGFSHRARGAIGVPLSDQSEAWAKREATSAIRKLLDQEVPELTALNKEFHFWKSLEDVLEQTIQRTKPQSGGLGEAIAEGAGRAVGGAAGASTGGVMNALGGAYALGKLSKMAKQAFTSPRYRLASAQAKDRLADAILSNNANKIAMALARITAVEGSKLSPAAAR